MSDDLDGLDIPDISTEKEVEDSGSSKKIKIADLPEWLLELVNKRNTSVATTFLLNFNVGDYVIDRFYLKQFITNSEILGGETNFDITLSYSLENGITFLDDTSEDFFREFLEMRKEDNPLDEIERSLNPKAQQEASPLPDFPLDVFEAISKLFGANANSWEGIVNIPKTLLFVDNIEMIMPETGLAQMSTADRKLLALIRNIAKSDHAMLAGSCIIMTTNNLSDVQSILKQASSRIENINIPLPDRANRLEFIHEVLYKERPDLFSGKIDEKKFASLTSGLSKMQVEDIALRAATEDNVITEDLVKKRKGDIIKSEYQDVIEIIDSDISFDDVGGLDQIKKYFSEDVIEPMKNEEMWRVPLGVMFLGPAGTGKAQPVSEPVLTPDGWKPIGSLKVGAHIIGGSGEPCTVTGVFPQKSRKVYRINFSDNTSVRAGLEHLWLMESPDWDTPRILSTKEIIETRNINNLAVSIPVINYSEKEFLMEPYSYGVSLGALPEFGTKNTGIDPHYLFGSIRQREALLQGLMDTCGEVSTNGMMTLCVPFVDDFVGLVRSLGGSCLAEGGICHFSLPVSISPFLNDKGKKKILQSQHLTDEWSIYSNNEYAKMNFKHNLYSDLSSETSIGQPQFIDGTMKIDGRVVNHKSPKNEEQGLAKYVVDVVRVVDEDCVCIMVDDPTHCYITTGNTLTHNTLVAQAVARESGMNCINLNIAKILDKYVGQSERNFEKALECIESMEPTIVLVEEIDGVFAGRGSEDNTGINGRLFKRFLEFMSDNARRGKSVIIATSNYPERMDAALRRPGRFDKKIPFFVPDQTGRIKIAMAIAKRNGFKLETEYTKENGKTVLLPKTQEKLIKIGTATKGMTGAEIEDIVRKAITYAFKEKRRYITLDDMITASSIVMPSTSAIREMTLQAIRECNDLDFIPKEYLEMTLAEKAKQNQESPPPSGGLKMC